MATIKKESFGKLSDGREVFIYTLRNTKGNELKVTDYGARVVSFRFRNKDFENKFILKTFADVTGFENDESAGVVFVDNEVSKIVWKSEQIAEGVKFSSEVGERNIEIIYSISNDNEVSIRYFASGIKDISTQLVFEKNVLPDSDITAFAEGAGKTKISSQTYNIIDKPAEVEMELGMFGYDPGCPIDYLEAGLKNAADIFSEAASIAVKVYATQEKIFVDSSEETFSIKTGGTKSDGGKIKAQTVYVFKNRK